MFDGENKGKAFAHIFTSQVLFIFLNDLITFCIVIDDTRQSSFGAGFVGSAFISMDIVGEAQKVCMIAIRILDSYFNLNIVLFAFDINRFFEKDFFVPVQEFDVALDPTFVMIFLFQRFFRTIVDDRDIQSFIQKGQFPHTHS
ncbi:hypothetical protein SDC9_58126 [bioreactor metagenome]|uniref:Uncharacterized protein n=1 Tax=bioreactor metagenome TaxID=1076179 RepID=A0A644X6L0_9ZZZZ